MGRRNHSAVLFLCPNQFFIPCNTPKARLSPYFHPCFCIFTLPSSLESALFTPLGCTEKKKYML